MYFPQLFTRWRCRGSTWSHGPSHTEDAHCCPCQGQTAVSTHWHKTGEISTASIPVLSNRETSSTPLAHKRATYPSAGCSTPRDLPSKDKKWGSILQKAVQAIAPDQQPTWKLRRDLSLNLPGFLNSISCHSRYRQWMVIPLLKLPYWFQQSETKNVRDRLYFQFRFYSLQLDEFLELN